MTVKYIYSKDLSANERIVMMHLTLKADENNSIQIGIDSMVNDLSIGETAIKRVLKDLVSKGYLNRKRVGLGNPNIYTIIK